MMRCLAATAQVGLGYSGLGGAGHPAAGVVPALLPSMNRCSSSCRTVCSVCNACRRTSRVCATRNTWLPATAVLEPQPCNAQAPARATLSPNGLLNFCSHW